MRARSAASACDIYIKSSTSAKVAQYSASTFYVHPGYMKNATPTSGNDIAIIVAHYGGDSNSLIEKEERSETVKAWVRYFLARVVNVIC